MSSTARASTALTVAAILVVSGSLTAGIASYASSQKRPGTTQLAGHAECQDHVWPFVQAGCALRQKVSATTEIAAPAADAMRASEPPAPAVGLLVASVAVPAKPSEVAAILPAGPVAETVKVAPIQPEPVRLEQAKLEPIRSETVEPKPVQPEVVAADMPRLETPATVVPAVEAAAGEATKMTATKVAPAKVATAEAEAAKGEPAKVETSKGEPATVPPDGPRPGRAARTARIYDPIKAPRAVEAVKALDAPLGESADGRPRVVRVIQIDRVPTTTAGGPTVRASADPVSPSPVSVTAAPPHQGVVTAAEPVGQAPTVPADAANADVSRQPATGQRARRQVVAQQEDAVDDEPRTRSRRYGRRSSYSRSYRYRRYARGDDYGRRSRYVGRSSAPDEAQPGPSGAQPGGYVPQPGQRVIYRRPAAGGILGWLGGTSEN